jgi:hypothetical protein
VTPLLLLAALSAAAGEPRAALDDPPARAVPTAPVPVIEGTGLELERWPGVPDADAEFVASLVKELHAEFPGLIPASKLERVVVRGSSEGNAWYMEEKRSIEFEAAYLRRVEADAPDWYRRGLGAKTVVFHELAHAWSAAHPYQLYHYETEVSDGRREEYEDRMGAVTRRCRARLGETTKKIDALARAEDRIWIGGRPVSRFYEEEGLGKLGLEAGLVERFHAETTEGMSLEAARKIAKLQEKASRLRSMPDRRRARLRRRLGVPGRTGRDEHGAENAREWYAYGAEAYFFVERPERFLSHEQMEWWAEMGRTWGKKP